ncbi:MAG: S-ribosylhomocysteine lyase [Clostridia bacterium]|nr:S-ribosylhomocysteine lyase [Clostridia bacterium]
MNESPRRIASFSVDHDYITPGIYISRIDGDITTYDLRTRTPNAEDYIDDVTMHSVEHMMATFLRNSEITDQVIYFGPMGCRTGFYLLVRDLPAERVLKEVKLALQKTIDHDGEMFGGTRKECGNYRCLDLDCAKAECRRYLAVLDAKPYHSFVYPTE